MKRSTPKIDVSVVLCTYNRCELLHSALYSLVSQETGGFCYEIVVVDNNSTDGTREVINSFVASGQANIAYVFENRQGLSHARNAGIKRSAAPIVAFTDDDVRVAPDWIRSVKTAFDEHPEIDFAGGKVLPRWASPPPAWLTPERHWAPVALTDYGDVPFYSNARNPVCLIGANIGIRRSAFERVGLFDPRFQRTAANIGSEDHEWLLRLWQAGGQGMYIPEMIVAADVPAERMDKAYHRMWHTGHGYSCGLMKLNELIDENGELRMQPISAQTFFGTPTFVYRDLLENGWGWIRSVLQRDDENAFARENRIRYLVSYIRSSKLNTGGDRKEK